MILDVLHDLANQHVDVILTCFRLYDLYTLLLTQFSQDLTVDLHPAILWCKCYSALNHTLHHRERSYET